MSSTVRVVPTLAEYLRGRRGVIHPENAGVPSARARRVPGLRREELAELASISPEYYQRLEQGRDQHPTDPVLQALARTLGVGATGLNYMRRLARPDAAASSVDVRSAVGRVLPLLGTSAFPAFVADPNLDIVATNAIALELDDGTLAAGRNVALELYLDRRGAPQRWESLAASVAGWLRMSARDDDPRAVEVVDTLMADARFRQAWQRYDLGPYSVGTIQHRVGPLGPVPFDFTVLEIPGAPGHLLFNYQATPGTWSAAALTWARAAAPDGTSMVTSRGGQAPALLPP